MGNIGMREWFGFLVVLVVAALVVSFVGRGLGVHGPAMSAVMFALGSGLALLFYRWARVR